MLVGIHVLDSHSPRGEYTILLVARKSDVCLQFDILTVGFHEKLQFHLPCQRAGPFLQPLGRRWARRVLQVCGRAVRLLPARGHSLNRKPTVQWHKPGPFGPFQTWTNGYIATSMESMLSCYIHTANTLPCHAMQCSAPVRTDSSLSSKGGQKFGVATPICKAILTTSRPGWGPDHSIVERVDDLATKETPDFPKCDMVSFKVLPAGMSQLIERKKTWTQKPKNGSQKEIWSSFRICANASMRCVCPCGLRAWKSVSWWVS
jgi:hypothetical protein